MTRHEHFMFLNHNSDLSGESSSGTYTCLDNEALNYLSPIDNSFYYSSEVSMLSVEDNATARQTVHSTPPSSTVSSMTFTRKTSALLTKFGHVISAYIALTKPRVIELLLISCLPIMLLADRGQIHLETIIITLLGGWMGAASANTLNMVVDADIDAKMQRTRTRPLAQHTVTKRAALIYGLTLGIASCALFYFRANALSAALILATILFYVFIYTIWLKRRTWQNVIWGGAAGCMPAVIGWVAQTNSISWQPLVLFGIVFFWTPPHTWALAMHYRQDYQAAGIPMLPVIHKEPYVTKQMLIYTILTVFMSLGLIPAAGILYALTAGVSGIFFIACMWRTYNHARHHQPIIPMRIFLLTNIYLAILCCALSLDSLLNLPLLLHFC